MLRMLLISEMPWNKFSKLPYIHDDLCIYISGLFTEYKEWFNNLSEVCSHDYID